MVFIENESDIFIDGMHLQHVLDNLNVKGIDFEKFSDKLANNKRSRTYFFDALPFNKENKPGKEKFLSKLNYLKSFQVEQGYVKMESIKCECCGCDVGVVRQKKVDVLLATRLVERSLETKRLVLVAGDADFVPAIEVAKRKAKVALAYLPGITAHQLIQTADEKIELSSAFFSDCKR
ncbi:MAG: NYN domain-containing protein [Thermoplasmatales archaeon]